MNDEEIKDLACQYVEEVYNGDTDFIDEAISIIGWLTKTYCIVSREKVQNAYRENCINEKDTERRGYDDYVYYFRNQQLRDIFGKSTFENNKTTDNEDNKDI